MEAEQIMTDSSSNLRKVRSSSLTSAHQRNNSLVERRISKDGDVTNKLMISSRHRMGTASNNLHGSSHSNNRKQFSSFVLFLSVVILVNLCPFQADFEPKELDSDGRTMKQPSLVSPPLNYHQLLPQGQSAASNYLGHIEDCLKFIKLMFSNPVRLGKRTTRFTQADAKVLGKMAKVWYIKKKIKKLGKKLKKHTIAVPVFTAIPIYEHPYHPMPHMSHMSHMSHMGHPVGMHHAASSYSPVVVTQMAAAAAVAAAAQHQQHQQQQQQQNHNNQMMAAASDNRQQQQYYRRPAAGQRPQGQSHPPAAPIYHQPHVPAANQIINAYVPSPPLFVDETGGLYGHYGNAYGRYDGGYHFW